MSINRITYAVSRNRAIWKCHDRLEDARRHLAAIAPTAEFTQRVQGFDAAGRSAVVDAPVRWHVEELRGTQRERDVLTICSACRSLRPADQSCGCFDNRCE